MITNLPDRQLQSQSQFSLMELFFVSTFSCIAIGIYIYVSSLLALLAGGLLIVVASVRFVAADRRLLGVLIGPLSSTLVAMFICVVEKLPVPILICILAPAPACGYIIGCLVSLFHEDS